MMAFPILEVIALAAVILFLLYYYSTSALQFWEKRGVKGPKPILFLGNFKDVFLGKVSINDCLVKVYNDFKDEPMVGIFGGHIPHLVLRDPDLIKDVLIKDFPNFVDRLVTPNKVERMSEHLFSLEAKRWRPLRACLSPIFTSGKLKEMFHLLVECGNHFEQYLIKLVEKGEDIPCREICSKYTTDVIGSCAFGIEMNALAAEDSEFRNMGRQIFQTNFKSVIRDRLREYPFLFNLIGPFFADREVEDFFTRITNESINYRMQHNFKRHDFIDTLVELKKDSRKVSDEPLSEVFLAAQAFVFFAAGFETSSITVTHALYELAFNQSVQDKLRAEVKEVLQRHNGQITYEMLKEMKYLDAVMNETLRKYPVVLWLSRTAMNDYTFSNTKVTIPKGQHVIVPVEAIQMDPDIYPEPEVFDPNRFLDENVKDRHAMFYLPFGDGPRNCIGARFAKIQSKVAMIKIFSNFKVDVCDKTMKYNRDVKAFFLLQPTHEIYLKMTKI
ncbi:cytochrome P450 6a2-like [Megachile rotundata]|uniref:cytochrome P450 6a2-like n=1 Tax=Megachile rotundata TaxID=143995 RepID=UPI003FD4E08F